LVPVTKPLDKQHKRDGFLCGEETLDRYIKQYASQDVKRGAAAVFVYTDADDTDDSVVLGYYTLSALSVKTKDVSAALRKRLARYEQQPATLIGRLAVDSSQQGKGLGEALLMDALYRSVLNSATVASAAVVVDALNENASKFYQRYGFVELPDTNRLVIGMRNVAKLF